MLKYRINVMEELKKRGYSTFRIREEKLIGQQMLQKLRTSSSNEKEDEMVSWATINLLCRLLECQVGDIVEYVPDQPEAAVSQIPES